MEISQSFKKAFSREVLLAERFRLFIITAIFFFIIVYLLVIQIFYQETFRVYFKGKNPLYWIMLILAFFALRSLAVRKVWSRWLERDTMLPNLLRYLNGFLEVSIPAILMIILGVQSESIITLFSPIGFLYLLFILLSILELDIRLCIFTGAIAAVQYSLLGIYYTRQFPIPEEMAILASPLFYIGKGILLFVCGIIAALAARQIINRIHTSFELVEARNRIEKLFGQQVSAEIVDEILNNRDEIESRRRFVCIMFLDIRDFTPYTEGKSPEEIIAFQNQIFSFMIEIINRHKGIINQFMGDGFMATFGAPVAAENPCQNAVDAAIEINRQLQQKNAAGSTPDTRIGIGLHAGEAVTGNVGTTIRKQYSVTGNVVILAARIEQLNKTYGSTILVSESVLNRISPEKLKAVSLGKVDIKGRSEKTEIFKID